MLIFLLTILLSLSPLESKIPSEKSVEFVNEASVEFVYEISVGSKSIGELHAVRRQQADSTVYLVTSDIDAQVGFHVVQDYRLESVYRNGILERSEIYNVINDKIRADTKIFREGESYIALKGGSKVLDQGPVEYSIARMFFSEPEGFRQVFSENFAEDIECNPEESDWLTKYCLRLPDRTKVMYYYDEGICEQFEVRLVIFNVRYSLKKVKAFP